jgi:O-acetyl-ADP-ribose deacetylase (regulator of RNase III)
MEMKVKTEKGSILECAVDVIVNAANSTGHMGGGVAGVIKRAAGGQVEKEAIEQAPIPVGKAVLTSAGKLPFKGIIHAPTMEQPAMRIPAENVAKATLAALQLADDKGFSSIALPGMGAGVGGVAKEEAAKVMIETIKAFPAKSIQTVILVDIDPGMIKAWEDLL